VKRSLWPLSSSKGGLDWRRFSLFQKRRLSFAVCSRTTGLVGKLFGLPLAARPPSPLKNYPRGKLPSIALRKENRWPTCLAK